MLAPVLGLAVLVTSWACKVEDPPPITTTFTDDFDRGRIGSNYYKTGGGYEIDDGVLITRGSYNHPLWLRKQLPRDVIVEFDCWSNTPDGDIKVEIFGDGRSYDDDGGSYTATGYVVIMGGWNNSRSIIARGNEHASGLPTRTEPKIEPGRKYHWKLERKGNRLDWWVDDMTRPFLSLDDLDPYFGAGHQYFGFNNWQSDSRFDNLMITPL